MSSSSLSTPQTSFSLSQTAEEKSPVLTPEEFDWDSLGVSVDRCPIHKKKSFVYCNDCKRLMCYKCTDCAKHNVCTINSYLTLILPVIDEEYIKRFKGISARILPPINVNIALKNKKLENLKELHEELTSMSEKAEEGRKSDIELIHKMINDIKEAKKDAFTFVLRELCDKVVELFDEDKIVEETENYQSSIQEISKKIKVYEEKIAKLEIDRNRALFLSKLNPEEELDDKKKFGLALIFEKQLTYCYFNNYLINNYNLFDKAGKTFKVDDIMKQDLIDVGENVMMTKPIKFDIESWEDDIVVSAAISHNGILASEVISQSPQFPKDESSNFCFTFGSHKLENALKVIDLCGNRNVKVENCNDMSIGFYDDKIVLITEGKILQCIVDELFSTPIKTKFEEIKSGVVGNYKTDMSLLHWTRNIYYFGLSTGFFWGISIYNVDSKLNAILDLGTSVNSIISVTGINIGSPLVYSQGGCIYKWEKENILEYKLPTVINNISVLFPSHSNPYDLSLSVFSNSTVYVRNGKELSTDKVAKYNEITCPIRVYKDVFLTYNSADKYWSLMRIVVP